MMFAARKLQGIGLIMLLTLYAFFAYSISLPVSTTRAELQQVEREIAETQQHNRMLEGDIAVLANVHQLDRWNAEFFSYTAPTAAQYLSGERELASLGSLRGHANPTSGQPVLAALNAAPTTSPDGAPSLSRVALLDRAQVTAAVASDIRRVLPVSAAGAAPPSETPQR